MSLAPRRQPAVVLAFDPEFGTLAVKKNDAEFVTLVPDEDRWRLVGQNTRMTLADAVMVALGGDEDA